MFFWIPENKTNTVINEKSFDHLDLEVTYEIYN